jgi:hypothetical protein
MDQLSGAQIFVMSLCALFVVGVVLTTWARAFAARKIGKWPEDKQ